MASVRLQERPEPGAGSQGSTEPEKPPKELSYVLPSPLAWLQVHLLYDSPRSDPRFQDLLRRMNLPRQSVQHRRLALLGNELLEMGHKLVPPCHHRLDLRLGEVRLGLIQNLVVAQLA